VTAGTLCPERRNAIAAVRTTLNNADADFGGLTKGAALFAVPIAAPNAGRVTGNFSRILCGYFHGGRANSSGVIIGLAGPDLDAGSGARIINVSLETVIVEPSAESVTGKYISVSSVRGGATLLSFGRDAFNGAMLSVNAELGYRLASNSNLRRLSGGVTQSAFSINIVSSSARFLEPSPTGLLATVLLAPGILAFKQGLALGAWRAPFEEHAMFSESVSTGPAFDEAGHAPRLIRLTAC
jgi:hypothetical protein